MVPDKYQEAWQSQSFQTRLTDNVDLLLEEAQRHQRELRTMIALADYGYIVFALLAAPAWIYVGVTTSAPWTWYLMAPVFLWGIGVTVVLRSRQKGPPNDPSNPLLSCVKDLLALVDIQSRRQLEAYWCSVLPTFAITLAFVTHVAMRSGDLLEVLIVAVGALAFLSAFFYVMYRATKRHVRRRYEPQRQELLALLASLEDETPAEGAGGQATTASSPFSKLRNAASCLSPTRMALAWLSLLVMFAMILLIAMVANHIASP